MIPNWFWPKARAQSTARGRLGRLAHWISYALALPILLGIAFIKIAVGRFDLTEAGIRMVACLLAIAVLGRGARYVLANE